MPIYPTLKRGWWSCEGVGPELKPQYEKKKNIV
jgi:hypothetical protein